MKQKIQDERLSLRIESSILNQIKVIKGKSLSDKVKRVIKSGLDNGTIDNIDYSGLLNGLREIKKEISPIGSNINQIALYLNSGGDSEVTALKDVGDAKIKIKELMKLLRSIEKEIHAK
jgi:virulence-associated protein VapD